MQMEVNFGPYVAVLEIRVAPGVLIVPASMETMRSFWPVVERDLPDLVAQGLNIPMQTAMHTSGLPMVYLIDARELPEEVEHRWLAAAPGAQKAGEVPTWRIAPASADRSYQEEPGAEA
jgi:hypothetical protein